jgi:glyoxylase-like metal-dependent hydrolase (beta-lactamase superfamily II)
VDTGRHAWHRDALLSLAVARRRPIVAVINSHWHLDHDSGNPFLRESYPHLTVYASSAIGEALQGFLADSLR